MRIFMLLKEKRVNRFVSLELFEPVRCKPVLIFMVQDTEVVFVS